MTDEERKKLYDLDDKVREIHRAFMVPPAGKKTALIEDIQTVSEAYRRGSFLARSLLWALPTLAGLIMAWDRIANFLGFRQ